MSLKAHLITHSLSRISMSDLTIAAKTCVGCDVPLRDSKYEACYKCNHATLCSGGVPRCTNFIKYGSKFKTCYSCHLSNIAKNTACSVCSKPKSCKPPFTTCYTCHRARVAAAITADGAAA